ncbi:MAG: PIN-like domain-containing protein [Thiopseudomonas sp.]|nr:PIN-like domain-containing protein [Thiopseudomonas sp.]MCK9464758.1 PIN-like domain-containing protein [Thiopseudomonas sp.]
MKQVCLMVLGMHRSGTSALTGMLQHLDIDLGSKLLPGSQENEKGFFENHYIMSYNDKLLEKLDSSWDDVFFSYKEKEILISANDRIELKEILLKEFENKEIFAIKDPRLCYLFPLYAEILTELNIDIKILLPYRNPLEVAMSLEKRNGFSLEKSVALWLNYFLYAEFYSRNHKRYFLRFDELLENTGLGDYFLWRHILNYAGNIKKPIIFVTSDAKEDWWERESGKTTGLHYELLKEMHSHSGMPFLAYTTDRFFSFSQKLGGQQSNQKAEEEITAYVRARNSNVNLVRVLSQAIETASESEHAGYITVELLRSAFAFTCSGPLVPNLEEIPNMQVSLHQAPEELPRHILRIGTGTKFDFNIHLKSTAYQELLPRGRYVFAYQATTEAMKQKIWPDR